MSKISSQPPRPTQGRSAIKLDRPKPPSKPSTASTTKAGRSQTKSAMRAVDLSKSERDAEHADANGGPESGKEPMTMGEKLALDRELQQEMEEVTGPSLEPYESFESQREDKLRNEETREEHERSTDPRELQQKPNAKGGTQQQSQSAHSAQGSTNAKQQAGAQQAKQQAVARGSDGFEGLQTKAAAKPGQAKAAAKPKLDAPLVNDRPSGPMRPLEREPKDAIGALNNAKDPGTFFVEQQPEGERGDEVGDPEMEAAVEECIRLLFGVRGIHRIGPGTNEAGEAVIVISTARGFSESSMRAIPGSVHRFKTLVALPYDLLPLRREL